jgi:hypothetical protein
VATRYTKIVGRTMSPSTYVLRLGGLSQAVGYSLRLQGGAWKSVVCCHFEGAIKALCYCWLFWGLKVLENCVTGWTNLRKSIVSWTGCFFPKLDLLLEGVGFFEWFSMWKVVFI